MQICKYLEICKYANICEYVNMQICKYFFLSSAIYSDDLKLKALADSLDSRLKFQDLSYLYSCLPCFNFVPVPTYQSEGTQCVCSALISIRFPDFIFDSRTRFIVERPSIGCTFSSTYGYYLDPLTLDLKILFNFLPDFIEFTFGIKFCAMLQKFNPLIPFPGIPTFELLNPKQLLLWSYCRYMGIRRNMFVLISIVPSLEEHCRCWLCFSSQF
jgi:hypothetical protein